MNVVFDKDKGLILQTDSMSFCSLDVNRVSAKIEGNLEERRRH